MPAKNTHPYTPTALEAVAEELKDVGNALDGIAKVMRGESLEHLEIWNHTEFMKAMKKIEAFRGAAKQALREHQIGDKTARG